MKNKCKNLIFRYNNFPVQLRASFWFLICSVLQKGISIITTPIFTRLFTTSEYGKYSVFISWENIIIVFVSLSLSAGVYQQGLIKYEEDRDKYSSSLIGLSSFLFLIWLLIYLLFSNFFNSVFSLKTSYMLIMFVMMYLGVLFNFWSYDQRVKYKYRLLIIFSLISSLLNPLLSILLMKFMKDKVLARILGICVSYLISYLWMGIVLLKKGKKIYSKKYWKNALLFNIPLIPHYLSQVILSGSDRIMIEKYISLEAAGIYNLAYSVSLLMILINSALMQTISPWLFNKIKNQKIGEIANVSYASLILVAFSNFLLISLAPEIIRFFAPPEYYEAIYVIPPIAISVYFMYTYDLFSKFEFYYEKTKVITIATIIGAVSNVFLNYLLLRNIGYIAAAYTTLFCYILYSVFHYIGMNYVCRKNTNYKTPYKISILLFITLGFIFLSIIMALLYSTLVYRLLLLSVIIIIILLFKNKFLKLFKF